MFPTVRAVGLAAVAFLAAAALWDGPLSAWQGDAPPAAVTSYLAHASVGADIGDLGLNDESANAAAADPAAERHLAQVPDTVPPSLDELVDDHASHDTSSTEQDCLANAVYFEARGESVQGQLAVAEVVLNRTRSGRYPATICAVVRQPAQFSFVRGGVIPRADRRSPAWRTAVAIARIAEAGEQRLLPRNVLWYHANYVAPGWGRRLERNTRIGLHIFYS